MPRNRDEIVQDAVRGIHEVVITHTKSKQGTIRTKEKLVPVVLPKPKPERSGQSSKSKKKSPPHIHSEDVQGQQEAIPSTGGAEENPYLDDQELFLPEPGVEESQPRSTVCLDSMNIDTYMLIWHRPRWSNGCSSGVGIFISSWKWRRSQHLTPVPYAIILRVSSVPTASGHLPFAGHAFHMHIGMLLSIDPSSGQQHITPRYPCSHWGLFCALGMLVLHVQARLRYVHITIPSMRSCSSK